MNLETNMSKWEITPPKGNFINLYEFGNKHVQIGNDTSKLQFTPLNFYIWMNVYQLQQIGQITFIESIMRKRG